MMRNLIVLLFNIHFLQFFHRVLPLGVFRRGVALLRKSIRHNNAVSRCVVLPVEPSGVGFIPYVSLLRDFQNSWVAVPKFLISHPILPCCWIDHFVEIIVECYLAFAIPFFIFARCSAFAFACVIKGSLHHHRRTQVHRC